MATGRVRRTVAGLRGGGRGWLLLALSTGWFFALGMRFVVPGILPTITADFEVSASASGFAITVMWAAYALMQFPAGLLTDRLGERALLTASLALAAGGMVFYIFTPTFALFVVATGVFGLGTGLYGPPRGTLLSKTFDDNDGAAFGLTLAVGSIGAAVLPALAAVAVTSLGWRTVMGVVALPFLLSALAVRLAVPGGHATTDGADHSVLSALAGAARGVRNRRVALAVAALTLMLFVFQAVTAFLTTYLTQVKGFSQGTAGAVLGALFLVGAGTQLVVGGLADRYGVPRVMMGVSAVSVVPMVALPLADARAALFALSAFIGVRMSIGPVSNAYIIDILPDDVQGTAWGALRTGLFVVGASGSTVVGVMADAGLFDAAFYLLGALTVVSVVIYASLPERSGGSE